jgi:hypothetical protein
LILGAAAASAPQQPTKAWKIGVLASISPLPVVEPVRVQSGLTKAAERMGPPALFQKADKSRK